MFPQQFGLIAVNVRLKHFTKALEAQNNLLELITHYARKKTLSFCPTTIKKNKNKQTAQ